MATNNLIVSNENQRKICFKVVHEIPKDAEEKDKPFMLTDTFVNKESETLWLAMRSSFNSKGNVKKEPPFPFAPKKVLELVNTLRDYPFITKTQVDEKFSLEHPDWIFELKKISFNLRVSCYLEYLIFMEVSKYFEELCECFNDSLISYSPSDDKITMDNYLAYTRGGSRKIYEYFGFLLEGTENNENNENKSLYETLIRLPLSDWIVLFGKGLVGGNSLHYLLDFVKSGTENKIITRVINGVEILVNLSRNSENEFTSSAIEKYKKCSYFILSERSDEKALQAFYSNNFNYFDDNCTYPSDPIATLGKDRKSSDSVFFQNLVDFFVLKVNSTFFSKGFIQRYLNNKKESTVLDSYNDPRCLVLADYLGFNNYVNGFWRVCNYTKWTLETINYVEQHFPEYYVTMIAFPYLLNCFKIRQSLSSKLMDHYFDRNPLQISSNDEGELEKLEKIKKGIINRGKNHKDCVWSFLTKNPQIAKNILDKFFKDEESRIILTETVELSQKMRCSFKKYTYEKICEIHSKKMKLYRNEECGIYDNISKEVIKNNISYSINGHPYGNGDLNIAETYDSADSKSVEEYRKMQAKKQKEKMRVQNQEDVEIREMKRNEKERELDAAKEEQRRKDKDKEETRKKLFEERKLCDRIFTIDKDMSEEEERAFMKKKALEAFNRHSYQPEKKEKPRTPGKGGNKQGGGNKQNGRKICK